GKEYLLVVRKVSDKGATFYFKNLGISKEVGVSQLARVNIDRLSGDDFVIELNFTKTRKYAIFYREKIRQPGVNETTPPVSEEIPKDEGKTEKTVGEFVPAKLGFWVLLIGVIFSIAFGYFYELKRKREGEESPVKPAEVKPSSPVSTTRPVPVGAFNTYVPRSYRLRLPASQPPRQVRAPTTLQKQTQLPASIKPVQKPNVPIGRTLKGVPITARRPVSETKPQIQQPAQKSVAESGGLSNRDYKTAVNYAHPANYAGIAIKRNVPVQQKPVQKPAQNPPFQKPIQRPPVQGPIQKPTSSLVSPQPKKSQIQPLVRRPTVKEVPAVFSSSRVVGGKPVPKKEFQKNKVEKKEEFDPYS
ncbi:hypothetical protein D6829_02770, partial [Candidatus Pacearchaeota archaeon]